jgi:chorismate mutase
MDAERDAVADDVAALKQALAVERAKGLEIAAELAVARAKASADEALIVFARELQVLKILGNDVGSAPKPVSNFRH